MLISIPIMQDGMMNNNANLNKYFLPIVSINAMHTEKHIMNNMKFTDASALERGKKFIVKNCATLIPVKEKKYAVAIIHTARSIASIVPGIRSSMPKL
jgi:hypothetical protein